MSFQLKNQSLLEPIVPDKIVFHIFLAPLGQQLAGISFEGIHTSVGLRRSVIP